MYCPLCTARLSEHRKTLSQLPEILKEKKPKSPNLETNQEHSKRRNQKPGGKNVLELRGKQQILND